MKKILIVGLGKSGFASAKLVASEGEVTAWDAKPEEKFDHEQVEALRKLGVTCVFGDTPDASSFDVAVLSPGVPLNNPLVVELKNNGCELTGELEEGYRHCKGKFFAITGTNGKTTTTSLVGEMVKAAGIPCEVVGNIGLPSTARAKEAGADTIMVTEVSSFQLETTSTFSPRVSSLLNVTPDHLNRHGTFEEYARVKGLVYANQKPDDFFIYNAEDPVCVELAKKAPCRTLPFSSRRELEYGAFEKDGRLVIASENGIIDFCAAAELKIPGRHNVENALAAIAMCWAGGIPTDAIRDALLSFKGVEHRIEFITEFNGVRYVNDSKGTNPDSTIKAIEATSTPILLIAGGYEKNSDFTELIENFNGKVKYLLLLGFTAKRFAECAVKCGFPEDKIVFCKDMGECVEKGRELAAPGDTVLLSPASASWDMYSGYEERGDHFRKLALSLK